MTSAETHGKVINIDPDHFKISSGKTKRKSTTNGPIRVKNNKPVLTSTLKNSIINMIRKHNHEKIKQELKDTLDESKKDAAVEAQELTRRGIKRATIDFSTTDIDNNKLDAEFNESIDFLSKLSESAKKKTDESHKQALHFVPTMSPVVVNLTPPSTSNAIPTIPGSTVPSPIVHTVPSVNPPPLPVHRTTIHRNATLTNLENAPPRYGILRGGELPTFRDWSNRTIRTQTPNISTAPKRPAYPLTEEQRQYRKRLEHQIQQASLLKQFDHVNRLYSEANHPPTNTTANNTPNNTTPNNIPNNTTPNADAKSHAWRHVPTQKRTVRRTYRVGKNSAKHHVSVLLPNKTIRAAASLNSQKNKQMPIAEVRKYLIRNGFIKIGSQTPVDILRSMFETAKAVAGEGEIKNLQEGTLMPKSI